MKKVFVVIFMLIFLICGISFATEYKESPLPQYSEDLGYGWSTKIPVDKPDNKQNVLKEWTMYSSRLIFVDQDKDGVCDIVYTFRNIYQKTENGDDLYILDSKRTCEDIENMINNFLKMKGI